AGHQVEGSRRRRSATGPATGATPGATPGAAAPRARAVAVEHVDGGDGVGRKPGAAAVVVDVGVHDRLGVLRVAEAKGVAELVGEDLRGGGGVVLEQALGAVVGDDVGLDRLVVGLPLVGPR